MCRICHLLPKLIMSTHLWLSVTLRPYLSVSIYLFFRFLLSSQYLLTSSLWEGGYINNQLSYTLTQLLDTNLNSRTHAHKSHAMVQLVMGVINKKTESAWSEMRWDCYRWWEALTLWERIIKTHYLLTAWPILIIYFCGWVCTVVSAYSPVSVCLTQSGVHAIVHLRLALWA